ncbi:MAG: hypothetical protein EOP82_24115 [Variovorax sp.]|nr:MAG: hypothetical protein EOP82_24115 [Variovorax sp.]
MAGEYRVASARALTLDVLAGARVLGLRQTLSWNIALTSAARYGSVRHGETAWDGVVGVKGRHAPYEGGKWSLPFYVDVGIRRVSLDLAGRRGYQLRIRVG